MALSKNEYLDLPDEEESDLDDQNEDYGAKDSRTLRDSKATNNKEHEESLSDSDEEDKIRFSRPVENVDVLARRKEDEEERTLVGSRLRPASETNGARKALSKIPHLTANRRASKPGVLYFSRLPPYLRPNTLRRFLCTHGTITNIFLTPEAPAARTRRLRTHHGNKKRQYVDGWVEFKHKRHAKACRDAINGRTTAEGMGVGKGKKGGGWYRDDIWSVRYLRGFTWDDLMREGRGEEREREERVRVGLAKEKRLRSDFLDAVQHAKIGESKRLKSLSKSAKIDAGETLPPDRNAPDNKHASTGLDSGRSFRQNVVKDVRQRAVSDSINADRVLGKIFG